MSEDKKYFVFNTIQELRDVIRDIHLYPNNLRHFYKGLVCPKCNLRANVLNFTRAWEPGWNCLSCNTVLDMKNAICSPHHTLHADPSIGLGRKDIVKAVKDKMVLKKLMDI